MKSKFLSDTPIRQLTPSLLGFSARPSASASATTAVEISPAPSLLGVPEEVYRQINGALKCNKTHFMFYGPPGTGKTSLALHVGASLMRSSLQGEPELITASGDWSSQDLIGGYYPTGNGQIEFRPGILLREFKRAVVIDEFNRCDIDKVLGPLFSMLAGVSTTLPYVPDPKEKESQNITVLAACTAESGPLRYSPGPDWHILATMNTSDKATLAIMSFALMRRFAWIYVGVPEDKSGFIREWCAAKSWKISSPTNSPVLAAIWEEVCQTRELGAAPFIDVLEYCKGAGEFFDPSVPPDERTATAYADGLSIFVIPLLDGMRLSEAQKLGDVICQELGVTPEGEIAARIAARLNDVAV